MKNLGVMWYDYDAERFLIAFDYGEERPPIWLHCGDAVDVLINERWVETRIELMNDYRPGHRDIWYLPETGLRDGKLNGLRVRCEE